MAERTLNQFLFLNFNQSFWALSTQNRKGIIENLTQSLENAAEKAYFYQVFPARTEADLLCWSAVPVENVKTPSEFFQRQAVALMDLRQWFTPAHVLWGATKPSMYSKGRSKQEIDPFQPKRNQYLVVYPFVKTVSWYLMSRDTRQGMMNEHIRIGHQYPEIMQLLLYSFGLQDQEFIVVYEMEDPFQFSDLVNELRSSEARRYTERDTPIYTAVYRTREDLSGLF